MQISREEIILKLAEVMEFTLGSEPNFTEESRLVDELGFSSVDMLYLMIATEESFSIRFENVGVMDLVTVGSVIDYIEARLK